MLRLEDIKATHRFHMYVIEAETLMLHTGRHLAPTSAVCLNHAADGFPNSKQCATVLSRNTVRILPEAIEKKTHEAMGFGSFGLAFLIRFRSNHLDRKVRKLCGILAKVFAP